jgi:hypothetical protein
MFVSDLGAHDVERPLPPVNAVFDEWAKHTVLLVQAVEERAHVTMPAEGTFVGLDGTVTGSHI